MELELAETIIELLKSIQSKPDSTVIASVITIGGMLGVAFITVISQWLVTKSIIRSEHNRLKLEISSQFKHNQFSKWQESFVETISNLLSNTDPEVYPIPIREKVVPLIQKAQLLLNLEIQSHRKVNGLINELGLAVNKWEERGMSEILGISGRLLEASRDVIYLPGK